MKKYVVDIIEASKELSLKEKIIAKDIMSALSLDELSKQNPDITFDYDFYALLHIHNESTENKDYKKLVIFAKDGTKYSTGSSSYFDSFFNIITEIGDCDIGDIKLGVRRTQSKNYKGKEFMTCVLV